MYICNKSYSDLHNETTGGLIGGSIRTACGGDVVVAPWIRYAEWLMTCPVILIALANLSGLKAGAYTCPLLSST
jgi:bacteriorhodopsin